MRKKGDIQKLKNNINIAKGFLLENRLSISQLAIKMNISYNEAQWVIFKMNKQNNLQKIKNTYQFINHVIPEETNGLIEVNTTNKQYYISSIEAKKMLMAEMLDVWQSVAVLAKRTGIKSNPKIKQLCDELKDGQLLISNKFRLDSHNQSYCYKKISYVKIFNVFMPIHSNEDEYV